MDFNEINDTISELKAKNQILENDLNFANKCLNVLIEFKNVFNRLIDTKSEISLLYLKDEDIQELEELNEKYDKIIDEKEIKSEVKEENKEFFISQNTDSLNALIVEHIPQKNQLTESNQKTANQPVIREKSLVSNEITLQNNLLAYTQPLRVVPKAHEMHTSENPFCLNQLIHSTNQSLNTNPTNLNQIQSIISLQNTGNVVKVIQTNTSKSALQFQGNQPKIYFQSEGQSIVPSIPNLVVWRPLPSDQLSNKTIKITNNRCDKEKSISRESVPKKDNSNTDTNQPKSASKRITISGKTENLIKVNKIPETSKTMFKCIIDDCNRIYKTKGLLECHQKSCHNTETALENYKICWKCGHQSCGLSFLNKSTLEFHILSQHKEPSFEDYNSEESPKSKNILNDVLKNNKVTELPIQCIIDDFNKTFKTKNLLKCHQKESHNTETDLEHYKYLCNNNSEEKCFKCDFPDCQKSYQLPSSLKRHQLSHMMAEPLKCKFEGCNYTTKHNENMTKHEKYTHFDYRPFVCKHCEKRLTTKQSLLIHLRTHTKVTREVCPVEGCAKLIKSYNLKTHIIEHSKQFVSCDYPGCVFKSKLKASMKKHKQYVHNTERNFVCECGKAFKSNCELLVHMKTHINERYFKCNFTDCKKSFKTATHLKSHEKYFHSQLKGYVCKQCKKQFKWKASLLSHLRSHDGVTKIRPQIVCAIEGCGKSVKNLKSHLLLVHSNSNKYISCDLPGCQFKCKTMSNLKAHKNNVHSSVRNYSCHWPECGKAFKTSGNLSTHMKSHTNDRPFACDWPQCEYRGMTFTNLKEHLRTHTKEKPFACEWPGCDYRCAIGHNMKNHWKVHQKD